MADSGSIQTVVVCLPSSLGQPPRPPGQAEGTPQPDLLPADQKPAIEPATAPFDYAYAAGLWSLAFCSVVGLYFCSHGIGLVLGMIRRG